MRCSWRTTVRGQVRTVQASVRADRLRTVLVRKQATAPGHLDPPSSPASGAHDQGSAQAALQPAGMAQALYRAQLCYSISNRTSTPLLHPQGLRRAQTCCCWTDGTGGREADPRVLVTTSRDPSSRLSQFAKVSGGKGGQTCLLGTPRGLQPATGVSVGNGQPDVRCEQLVASWGGVNCLGCRVRWLPAVLACRN